MEARSGRRGLNPARDGASLVERPGDWRCVDWQAPWYRPWAAIGRPVLAACANGQALWQALNAAGRAPVRFVPVSERDAGRGYETQVHETGGCPTRDGGHDAFNGLCWLRFPRAKSAITRLHAEAARTGSPAAIGRGPLRDALTLLDESGALLCAPPAMTAAIAAKDWSAVFGSGRSLWAQVRVELFGHALLDRLRHPYPAITAHVLPMPEWLGSDADIDAWLAARLQERALTTRDFLHLPVLGIPGWWPANADAGFYADTRVFRPARAAPGDGSAPIPHPLRAYAAPGH